MNLREMPEAELRQFARELFHENRRLRAILALLPSAGLGAGAVVEVVTDTYDTARVVSIVVCRADRDEIAFVEDVRGAMQDLAAAAFPKAPLGEPFRTGSTRGDAP